MGALISENVKIRQYIIGLIAAAPSGESLQRIPTERELCQVFKISRPTLRKTLQKLEDEGFLIRKPHFGTFINNEYRSQVNYHARQHKVVGLVVGNGQLTFLTPYFMTIMARLFDTLATEGCQGRLLSLDGDPEHELAMLLDSKQLDGLIFITPPEAILNCVPMIKARGIPLVATLLNADERVDYAVYNDYYRSYHTIVEYLLSQGHRNILFLENADDGKVWLERKKTGAVAAFAAAGIPWNERLWHLSSPIGAGEVVENICRYGSGFTAAVVAEAFHGLVRNRFESQPEMPVIQILGRYDPRQDGFQIISPSDGIGRAAGELMMELLNAPPGNVPPRRVQVDFEVHNPLKIIRSVS